ncbi:NAD(P)/FAD-dependent oxidoreductase [Novosphingobium mathurense]|uniref:Dehydrogenase (Flavoprotein) n=1 Tax=Novosphingobium mathurense TaxID=428990 RepID=A0A1U6I4D6_9SPHN|nr:NAD(P)/FAD-dependent oxidoreductase [Novosphingobium mathurense]SLK02879.1 Dehydrogenase (flavoprotein) [Novosphingobium mathurense]
MNTPTWNHERYDAVVVGARPAGAATAMLLARGGARVLMVDRSPLGSDTLSTHALMRGAVMQLVSWRLEGDLLACGTPGIERTSFHYGQNRVDIDIRPAFGTDCLYAPRRTVLDRVIADAAEVSGVERRYGLDCMGVIRKHAQGPVSGVILRDTRGAHYRVEADIVIGADGRQSRIAREVDARYLVRMNQASMSIYGYFTGMPNDGFRWYWGEQAAAGAIPTNNGASCVFLSLPRDRLGDFRKALHPSRFLQLMQQAFPELGTQLSQAVRKGRLVGFPGQPGYMRECAGPGWALVGDAGWFKDPLTAHGITDALRDAQILADAVLAGTTCSYATTRDGLSHGMLEISDRIGSFDWDLEGIAVLHEQLNREMKANQNWIADNLMRCAVPA